jgi:hypothetical protein
MPASKCRHRTLILTWSKSLPPAPHPPRAVGGTRCGKVQIKSSRLDSAYFVRSLRQSQPAAAPHEQSLASPAESRCALHAEATRVAESESEYMMAALAGTYIETEYEKEIPAEAGPNMLSWISVTSFWTWFCSEAEKREHMCDFPFTDRHRLLWVKRLPSPSTSFYPPPHGDCACKNKVRSRALLGRSKKS